MNIGMMGGWNTDSGASFHTELIGRTWRKKGHKLAVFTFYDYAFHGTQITGEDEEYVRRCFTVEGYDSPEFDPIPFLTEEYEIFVAEDLGMLPKDSLRKIFHHIRKRAKTVNVIHDGKLSQNPSFYQFDWDAVVCFDERYRDFLVQAHEPSKLHLIPYPCYSGAEGDKLSARKSLSLPVDEKIVLAFGPSSKAVLELLPSIEELSVDYPISFLVVTKDQTAMETLKNHTPSCPLHIELREEAPNIDRLYDYLHASDALVFNKGSASHVVLSSTAFQCLSSGCPIVARNSNYVECFDREVMKFDTPVQFKEALRAIFDETEEYRITRKAAEDYARRNSADAVAEKFISLFERLLKGE